MKPPRPSPPRTLADPPPLRTRSPQTAATHTALPTLAALVASGVVIPGCHDPECGSTRADEIAQHGPTGVRAVRDGQASAALREIGVALGVLSHDTGSTGVHVQGAETSVTTHPNEMHSAGVAVPVQISPLDPLARPTPPTTTTAPHPPEHSLRRGGARRPTTPAPHRALRGEMKPVGPEPRD